MTNLRALLLSQFTEYAEGADGLSPEQVGTLTETIQLMADGAKYRIHGVLDAIAELESQA